MLFTGITKTFSTTGEDQYNTISNFWDELEDKYSLSVLRGLGYDWDVVNNTLKYSIGFKRGTIPGYNTSIILPNVGWEHVRGYTKDLKEIYDEIYRYGRLKYEIETFDDDGRCHIMFIRERW